MLLVDSTHFKVQDAIRHLGKSGSAQDAHALDVLAHVHAGKPRVLFEKVDEVVQAPALQPVPAEVERHETDVVQQRVADACHALPGELVVGEVEGHQAPAGVQRELARPLLLLQRLRGDSRRGGARRARRRAAAAARVAPKVRLPGDHGAPAGVRLDEPRDGHPRGIRQGAARQLELLELRVALERGNDLQGGLVAHVAAREGERRERLVQREGLGQAPPDVPARAEADLKLAERLRTPHQELQHARQALAHALVRHHVGDLLQAPAVPQRRELVHPGVLLGAPALQAGLRHRALFQAAEHAQQPEARQPAPGHAFESLRQLRDFVDVKRRQVDLAPPVPERPHKVLPDVPNAPLRALRRGVE